MAAPPPPPQKIITDEFLLICLKYEFLKKNDTEKVFAHICQMMLSKCIREEVTDVEVVTTNDSPSGSTSQSSRASTEGRNSNSSDEPGPSEPSTSNVNNQRRRREGSDSGDFVEEVGNKRRKIEMQKVEDEDESVDDEKDEEDYDEEEQEEKEEKREHKGNQADVEPPLGADSDSDKELDSEPIRHLAEMALYHDNERNVQIKTISSETINEFFIDFEKGFNKKKVIVPREYISHLNGLRFYAYCGWLGLGDEFNHSYNEIKSTIDFYKVKLFLNNFETKKNIRIEHWDGGNGGCWMWFDDNVRFIEDLDYELLAANEFIESLVNSEMPLKSLEFDIEEKTKWSPKLNHSAVFWYKIKRTVRRHKTEVGARKFSMTVLKCRGKIDCPFKLRFLKVGKVEEIKLRVWDDSDVSPSSPKFGYLTELADLDQWKNASIFLGY